MFSFCATKMAPSEQWGATVKGEGLPVRATEAACGFNYYYYYILLWLNQCEQLSLWERRPRGSSASPIRKPRPRIRNSWTISFTGFVSSLSLMFDFLKRFRQRTKVSLHWDWVSSWFISDLSLSYLWFISLIYFTDLFHDFPAVSRTFRPKLFLFGLCFRITLL